MFRDIEMKVSRNTCHHRVTYTQKGGNCARIQLQLFYDPRLVGTNNFGV
jgi:hypothetical protein